MKNRLTDLLFFKNDLIPAICFHFFLKTWRHKTTVFLAGKIIFEQKKKIFVCISVWKFQNISFSYSLNKTINICNQISLQIPPLRSSYAASCFFPNVFY